MIPLARFALFDFVCGLSCASFTLQPITSLSLHEPLFDSDPMESNTALAAWTAQELVALCCEVALLADLVKQGAVSFSKPGDFYSAVSANLLRRHSVSRSASALRSKYNKIRDEAIAASQGLDERNLLAQCVAQFAPIYPGQPVPAPLPPHAYSAEEQAAVLKYKAEWGLDMAEAGSLQSMAAAARAALEEDGEQQQQQQQQQPQGSFTLPHHGK